jgi:23S rRNA (adenine1618-N6)-methyltransferase
VDKTRLNTQSSKSKNSKNSASGSLHPRNPHQGRYDLDVLTAVCPELKSHLKLNPKGEQTVNFANEEAVRLLNQALLAHHYQVQHWNIPDDYLCPPIPGRADYIHYAADLLTGKKNNAKVLDIGTGANCIYPIIGSRSYGWRFVASDIDPIAVSAANLIVDSNAVLKNKIKVLQQKDKKSMFAGVIAPHDLFDLTLCNPPFHASLAEANAVTERKQHNLNRHKVKYNAKSAVSDDNADNGSDKTQGRNFGGQKAELWCDGGEVAFLKRMITESQNFSHQVMWFTSLVSKSDNVKPLKKLLNQVGAKQVKVVNMSQGQKVSRLIAWSFLTNEQLEDWNKQRLQS